jgi:tetratricopeptide (TPR) repeat protein
VSGIGRSPTGRGAERQDDERTGSAVEWRQLRDAHIRATDAGTGRASRTCIFRETGDRHSEGGAWDNLGLALGEARRFDEAITAHQQDLAICRELSDRHGEGTAWANLGLAYAELSRPDMARHAWMRAVDLFVAVGDDELAARVRRWSADLDE